MGLFVTPEESTPPRELRDLGEELASSLERQPDLPPLEGDGFVRAVVDPYINALHRALLGPPRSLRAAIRARRQDLVDKACAEGPSSLDAAERRVLLYDPQAITDLHRHVWALPAQEKAAKWGRPG
jgi:membrane glycosyltransferase